MLGKPEPRDARAFVRALLVTRFQPEMLARVPYRMVGCQRQARQPHACPDAFARVAPPDEPLGALSIRSCARRLQKDLKEASRACNRQAILVTHDLAEAAISVTGLSS